MSALTLLDGWWREARRHRLLHRFAWMNRVLLAIAFTPSGVTKLLGLRFTRLPVADPVGFFFEALYRAGIYWRFLGFAQLAAALLLLIPRTHALGALMYFPIILNIFLITVGIGFTGTPFITGAMLLASLFLVCWHYDAWRPLISPATPPAVQWPAERSAPRW